jgi:hypothetical protein
MRDRFVSSFAILATAAVVLLSLTPTSVRTQATSASTTKTATKGKPWVMSHTPDGQPDLQGYWTNLSFTPMERPDKFGNREFLTDAEVAEVFKAGVQHSYEFTFDNPAGTPVYDATQFGLDAWQNGVKPNKRTSLIVDPPDGKFPPLTPRAQQARAAKKATATDRFERPVDLGLGIRCLTFPGNGPPMLPAAYNSNYQIVQSPGYVTIESEWNSITRIIPLDGRPHLSQNIHRWQGDSRGHWDGNTLVVETTNFRPEATYQDANAQTLRIIERFTRLDADTIEYKFTVDDPSTWTKPWTGIIPMSKVEGPLFEYACSEGNNDVINMLEAARESEKPGKQGPNKETK